MTDNSAKLAEQRLAQLTIELPSWGFGDSGTRFAVYPQPGRPRDVFEKLEDAAEVHRVTGTAGAVALHFPWDSVEEPAAIGERAAALGLTIGTINPNLFQEPEYRLGALSHPDGGVRERAIDHVLECSGIARTLSSSAISLWLADGTNYPGQDNFRRRRGRLNDSLARIYAELPVDQELLIEYKLFEPAFYSTDLADWGSALLACQMLGDRARVLVDLGHHAQATNVEQIVALLSEADRLGGFHFNNRKYGDDDLIVGSTNPWELFLLFVELTDHDAELPRLTIDQTHNVEPKLEALVLSVVHLQEALAKALLVDHGALQALQDAGDVLGGYETLLSAYHTDVRPLCARTRLSLGAAEDPVAEARRGDHLSRARRDRVNVLQYRP